jgi:two-component system, NtrC family, sensor histidine kinase PilS
LDWYSWRFIEKAAVWRCRREKTAYFVGKAAPKQNRHAGTVTADSRRRTFPRRDFRAHLSSVAAASRERNTRALRVSWRRPQLQDSARMRKVQPLSRAVGDETVKLRLFDDPDLTWRVLGTLNLFRLLTAVVLLGLFFAVSADGRLFGERYPALFSATAAGYLVFAAISGIAIRQRWVAAEKQALAQVLVDVAAVITLMHASGGIGSGLGGLLIIFVGAGSLVLPAGAPTFFAALATLGVLGEQFFSLLGGTSDASNYPAAGILGATIFVIALAAKPLARRIQQSEELAHQRGIDLANLSELNEYIVQHLRESIVVLDSDDRVRLMNTSAAQLLGAPDSSTGVPLGEISPTLSGYISAWRADSSRESHLEFTMISEGHSVRLSAHLAPLGSGDERSGPILVFLEDSSIMNARVQQSKLASLGRLSASIAHEIRNPVGAMSHAGQLLAESPALGEEDLRLTEIIRTHAERVSHIVDNVLQLSRRESSRPEQFALKPWLEEFAVEFSGTLELQEGELTMLEVPETLEVRMDPGHLRQVLWNLCDNAVKYASETGGILVELQAGRMLRTGRPYLEVLDRGHGVDTATADKIFEPFFTARQGGTGLGLYISRELCELNRATLVHQARDGGGSIFRVVFADPNRWEAVENQ